MFAPDLVVRSRRVVTARGTRPAAIHVRNGRVIGVLAFEDVPAGCPVDDAADAVVMPGVIDTHVHANDPGCKDGDTFETVTRAAAAGGITTIGDMPFVNTPPTTTIAALESKRRTAEGRIFVDVGFWAGIVPDNAGEIARMADAGVLGFACALARPGCAEYPPVSEADLQVVMPALTRIGATLIAHAELAAAIERETEGRAVQPSWFERTFAASRRGRRRYQTYVESRPKAVENDAVALLIQLCRSHRTRMHVAHLSSSDALAPLYHARMARLPLTAETCPHYLHFVAEDIADGAASCRCDPPIRDRENRELLWAAVANKLIQLVVSDHCASPPRAKREASNDALYGPRGIASIQVSLPVTWTGARERGCTLDQVVDWMCRAPADLAGLSRKGRIDAGYDADLVIFDPDAEFTVDRRSLEPRHSGTPYLGRALSGIVERTYLRGTRIFTRGQQPGLHPSGALLTRH